MKQASKNQRAEMKARLKKIAEKKFMTTTIFPLSQFEIAFGHLWGHGKKTEDRSHEEKVNFEKWQEVRDNILNNGNSQKRAMINEIDNHEIEWKRYSATFIPVNRI